jgi:hypothetical protein
MARNWLQVMSGEVQSKADAAERLRERREAVARIAGECLETVVRPAMEAAAKAAGAEYREEEGSEALYRLCRIDGDAGRVEAAFDAFRPLLLLTGPGGEREIVRLDGLEHSRLEDWLRRVP